jgi:hypothetical protein
MPNQQGAGMPDPKLVRAKLQELAAKVQGRITTYGEDKRLDEALEATQVRTEQDVHVVIGKALEKSASTVQQILASHDNTDRLIDDIVRALQK